MDSKLVFIFLILLGVSVIFFRKKLAMLQTEQEFIFNRSTPLNKFSLTNKISSSNFKKIGNGFYTIVSVIAGVVLILVGTLGLFGVFNNSK